VWPLEVAECMLGFGRRQYYWILITNVETRTISLLGRSARSQDLNIIIISGLHWPCRKAVFLPIVRGLRNFSWFFILCWGCAWTI